VVRRRARPVRESQGAIVHKIDHIFLLEQKRRLDKPIRSVSRILDNFDTTLTTDPRFLELANRIEDCLEELKAIKFDINYKAEEIGGAS
jgi:hypothetical protein